MLTVIDAAALAAGRFADDPVAVARQRAADPALEHDNPLDEVFGDQLACADLVILNKTDLVAPDALAAARGEIERAAAPRGRSWSPRATARWRRRWRSGSPPRPRTISPRGRRCTISRPAHDHDDFDSFVVTLGRGRRSSRRSSPGCAPRSRAHDVLRLKGFVDVPGRDRRQVVQAVGDRVQHYFDRPWQAGEARATRLVVIGEKGLDRAAIAAALGG